MHLMSDLHIESLVRHSILRLPPHVCLGLTPIGHSSYGTCHASLKYKVFVWAWVLLADAALSNCVSCVGTGSSPDVSWHGSFSIFMPRALS